MAAVRLLLILLLLQSPLSLSITDSEALLKVKNSLSNTQGLNSWVPNTSPCDAKNPWDYVMCNDAIMTGLRLTDMNLSGTIDIDALLELQTLRTISLENNSFSGPIPEFNRLGYLKALSLSLNDFSGEIPSDFFIKMGSLKKVWLSGNNFVGKIPESLGQIPTLIELHLEDNEFSGPIPKLEEEKSLTSMNLSNNNLQGEIPTSISRFGPGSFQGNPGLCGKPLGKDCNQKGSQGNTTNAPPEEKSKQADKSTIGWVVIGVIGFVLAVTVFVRLRLFSRREDQFDRLQKENLDEVVEVQIPTTERRSIDSSGLSQKGGSVPRKGSSQNGKVAGMGDLVMVNDEKGAFGLGDLMKASAEVLGNGGLGSVYKAVMGNGLAVVVKRMREMNRVSKDGFDTEMRRLGRIRHRNILTPLGYHYRRDEKLLVSEFVSKGSLLYNLHGDRGISHAGLNWPTRLKIIKGVASGISFLHSEFASYELPHGNLKSSNVLLDSTYEPILSDYAFYPLLNNTQAVQAMFAFKSPEAMLHQQVTPKSDVFCLGIVILEIITGKFPSQYLSKQKGGTDVVQWAQSAVCEKKETELIDPEIGSTTNSLAQMVKLLHIGAACTESSLDQRIDMKEAIRRIEEIQP